MAASCGRPRTSASTRRRSRKRSPKCLCCHPCRRPRPLKIETAETSVDVEDLSHEKQAPTAARLHACRVDLLERNAARGHLREVVPPTLSHVERRLEQGAD